MRADKVLYSGPTRIAASYARGLDFVVGPDNPFIRLLKSSGYFGRRQPVLDSLTFDSVTRFQCEAHCGLVHMLDVTADDPGGFLFHHFSRIDTLSGGRDLTGVPLQTIEPRGLVAFSGADHKRVRDEAKPDLATIEIRAPGMILRYRRLLLPMYSDKAWPTHVVIATARESLELTMPTPASEAR